MLDVTINLNGKTTHDLDSALQEVRRLLSEGFLRGRDQNETGSYSFDVAGEEEESEDEEPE